MVGKGFVLAATDHVAVALSPISAGMRVQLRGAAGGEVVCCEPVQEGHKIAVRDASKGEHIIKGGFPIGIARMDIRAGTPVHTHNLQSSFDPRGFEGD